MVACSLLLVSAAVALGSGEAVQDPAAENLIARGWAAVDHVECPGLSPGTYYEVSGEQSSAEVYFTGGGGSLASRAPLPDPPYECRKIQKPHFVEEI